MKKHLFLMIGLAASLTAAAQGNFSMSNFDGFTVHVYQPTDSEAAGSFVVESKSGLVVLNPSSESSFNDYMSHMTKPVTQNVEISNLTMGTQNWNGVVITINPSLFGVQGKSDMNIGGGLYMTHALPTKAHACKKLISNPDDIDKLLSNLTILTRTGCKIFADEHGNVVDAEQIKFMQKYYNIMKKNLKKSTDAASFIDSMKKAFPELNGENDLQEVAQSLY